MRFAAIADIHGNHLALEAVLADIAAQGISSDHIVNLGDCFSGPLEAGHVAARLRSLNLPMVMGNHDRYLIEQCAEEMAPSDAHAFGQLSQEDLDWLKSLPFDAVFQDVAYLCHATPRDDNCYWLETVTHDGHVMLRDRVEIEAWAEGIDQPLILCGHSHLPRVVTLSEGQLIINPGSVGCPAYDDEAPVLHRMETGNPFASYAICEDGPAGWTVSFRRVPYDDMAQSRLAAQNGRPSWANGLATGRLA